MEGLIFGILRYLIECAVCQVDSQLYLTFWQFD